MHDISKKLWATDFCVACTEVPISSECTFHMWYFSNSPWPCKLAIELLDASFCSIFPPLFLTHIFMPSLFCFKVSLEYHLEKDILFKLQLTTWPGTKTASKSIQDSISQMLSQYPLQSSGKQWTTGFLLIKRTWKSRRSTKRMRASINVSSNSRMGAITKQQPSLD